MPHLVVLALALAHSLTAGAETPGVGNIYQGEPTADFPAVVGLAITHRDGTQSICTGTLIAPSAVLTAAHCLAFDPLAAVVVVFANGTRVDYQAAGFVRHPRFNPARPSVADIGIVLLSNPVENVAPVPLAQRSPRPGATGTIVGYGESGDGPAGRKRVGTVRLRRCPRAVRVPGGRLPLRKSLCWRSSDGVHDTCNGDSGGPLLVSGAVAGVTSGGIGFEACPSVLSFDTNVARYRTWIASVVGQ